jgi:hypothetical protein
MNNLDQDMFLGMRSQLEAIKDENERLRALIDRIAAVNADFLAEMAAENQRLIDKIEVLESSARTTGGK